MIVIKPSYVISLNILSCYHDLDDHYLISMPNLILILYSLITTIIFSVQRHPLLSLKSENDNT